MSILNKPVLGVYCVSKLLDPENGKMMKAVSAPKELSPVGETWGDRHLSSTTIAGSDRATHRMSWDPGGGA